MGKNYIIFFIIVFSTLVSIPNINAKSTQAASFLPSPSLKEGRAFIKGQIKGYSPISKSKIRISYNNPIINENEISEVEISHKGDFFLTVELVSISTCLFISDYYKEYILLSPGDTCFINIDASKIDKISNFDVLKREQLDDRYVYFKGVFADVNNDLNILRFWSYNIPLFKRVKKGQTPNQYKNYVLETLEMTLSHLTEQKLSKRTMELITIELQQNAIRNLLDFDSFWKNYLSLDNYPEPTVSSNYFSFLKELNINKPSSFYGRFFSTIMNQCISIEDNSLTYNDLVHKRSSPQKSLTIKNLKKQSKYLSKILGESSGTAFDMLDVQNINSKIKYNIPLVEWEKERLKQLSNPFYYEYLIKKNDSLLLQRIQVEENPKSVLIDVTNSKSDNYFEEILDLYKGKILFVTYWSIGCRYALNAINIINPMYEKYHDKDIVFLYITDDYYLPQIWKNKAMQIDGFNYRLSKKQINYFMNQYKIDGTPSFVIFNKDGKCLLIKQGFSDSNIKDIISLLNKSI